MNLLIVESPGKLKTLRKILGPGWILEASIGHTTELAQDGVKNLGFEIGGGRVITRYQPRGTRGKQVLSKLRSAVKKADQVYLAMDPDREGEAIAWHLVQQLKLKSFKRVAYSQITDSAVKSAIRSPRALDFSLVEAQRARQCLDKLVGFEVSPLLWKTSGGKSAGRVQSATLHLICQRERERLAFVPEDYWTLHSKYSEGLIAQYEPLRKKSEVDKLESTQVKSFDEALRVEGVARNHPHLVKSVIEKEELRNPLPPLITSSLQQTAGVRFKYPPQKTMKIAQELYEGVGGQGGLITYMRTDQITLSPEFIKDARRWLMSHKPEAIAERPPVFRTKSDAQGAHEAIRPTSVDLTPERAARFLNRDQLNIYDLIWKRAVASQCRPARLAKTTIEIFSGDTRWITRGLRVAELGYLQFWKNVEEEKQLPRLREGQVLGLKDIKIEKKSTQPPARYSEAKLIQLMEKLGIGRPSTYASTVITLKDRGYAVVENGALTPTPLGLSTDEVLTKAMPDLVDVQFTAQMEASLDKIAESQINWEKFLSDWSDNYFQRALQKAQDLIRDIPGASFSFEPQKPKKKFRRKNPTQATKKKNRSGPRRGPRSQSMATPSDF